MKKISSTSSASKAAILVCAPAPKTAALKPEAVIETPWAKTVQEQRERNLHADDPLARCLPQGVPRVNTNGWFPFKIIKTPGEVVILYEQLGAFRQIVMDVRKLAKDVNPTGLGYSTGRWDGDTLVIDTAGFNGKAWQDYAKPWTTAVQKMHLLQGTGILEFSCDENEKDQAHMPGK